ncbi:CTTNBP2, partial [Symbiodinium necroappetens]
ANDNEVTPLYIAAQEGQLEVAHLLLQANADMNKATRDGATPVHAAELSGHLEFALLLHGSNTQKSKRIRLL